MSTVQFVVGNEHQPIPLSEAKLDRSGKYRKTHDVTIFCDIVDGSPDVIERVVFDLGSTFQPSQFICHSPVAVTRPNSMTAYRSNRESIGGETNKDNHLILEAGSNINALAHVMNRDGRYYKLNLQNLVSGRQPTIEFRQHSATSEYSKVAAWIRFCVWFVKNSASFAASQTICHGPLARLSV